MANKKIWLGMLTIALAFVFAVSGCASKPAVTDDGLFEYKVGMGKMAIITNYFGTDSDIVIPGQINGNIVYNISAGASSRMTERDNAVGVLEGKSLTSVVFPDSLSTIEMRAFAKNNLTSVTLPDGVSLGEAAFAGNPITRFTLGEGIRGYRGSLGTLTPYFYGNDKKPGEYTRNDDGVWAHNGSVCKLPAIIKMADPEITLIGLDGKSKGAMDNEYREYSVSGEHWIPAGTHTLRVALPAPVSGTGGAVSLSGGGPSAELRGSFEAGIVYLISENDDKTGVRISPQGPWSPPQD